MKVGKSTSKSSGKVVVGRLGRHQTRLEWDQKGIVRLEENIVEFEERVRGQEEGSVGLEERDMESNKGTVGSDGSYIQLEDVEVTEVKKEVMPNPFRAKCAGWIDGIEVFNLDDD